MSVDATSAAGHCLAGTHDMVYRWDWDSAAARFPGAMGAQTTGHLLCLAHRYGEAIEWLEPWIEREPNHHMAPLYSGVSYVGLGQVEKGLALMERGRQISDKNPIAEIGYVNVLERLGREDEARAAADELFERSRNE